MRKPITILFVVLFCLAIGIGECQEKELSKEEKLSMEKAEEKMAIIVFYVKKLSNLIQKADAISTTKDPKLFWEKMATIHEEISATSKKIATLTKELLELEKGKEWFFVWKKPKEKPQINVYDLIFEDSKKRIDEENWAERLDEIRRIEREIRRIEFDLDMDRMMFLNDMMFIDQLCLYLLLRRK